jgi:hypothetical protein
MTLLGAGLFSLGLADAPALAYPLLATIGFCAVAQFNSTNTLFQLLAPDRLRGRVLSMHIWALSGLNPLGTVFFGWYAERTSIPTTLFVCGFAVLLCAGWGWLKRDVLDAQVPEENGAPVQAEALTAK